MARIRRRLRDPVPGRVAPSQTARSEPRMRLSPHFGATFVLLSGTLFLTGLADRRIPEPLAAPLDGIRTNLAGWTAVRTETLSPGVLKQLDPTSYLSRVYKKGPTEMSVFIA